MAAASVKQADEEFPYPAFVYETVTITSLLNELYSTEDGRERVAAVDYLAGL